MNGASRGLRDPSTLAVAIVVLVLAPLYAATLCRTVYWYDSAEFAAHATVLGVPHPPGYPLYTLIAHVFTRPFAEPAFGVNVMSLVFGLVSAGLLARLAVRTGASPFAAVFAGVLLGTSRTFWANAVVAEVYTPGLAFTLAVLVLLERAETTARARLLPLAGLVAGLGVGMHMSIATCGLGYAWLVLAGDVPSSRVGTSEVSPLPWQRRLALGFAALASALAGLLVFLYVPLRSFERWDRREWIRFVKNATGGTFRLKFMRDYDEAARARLVLEIFLDNLHVVGIVLAVVGVVVLLRRRPRFAIGVVLAALGNGWWFFNYNVPDLDVFYLPALALACLTAAFGLDAAAAGLARVHPTLVHLRVTALALPLSRVLTNHHAVDLSHETEASLYGREACDGIEQPAIILSYSTPEEWRYYSVFIYEQAAHGRCLAVEIVKKPTTTRARELVGGHRPVYVFLPTERARAVARPEPAGKLWRLFPKGRRRQPSEPPTGAGA